VMITCPAKIKVSGKSHSRGPISSLRVLTWAVFLLVNAPDQWLRRGRKFSAVMSADLRHAGVVQESRCVG
jgi:hypothetical protein